MNYLAHALGHLRESPTSAMTVAGSALPDWLRACHPEVRLSAEQVHSRSSSSAQTNGLHTHAAAACSSTELLRGWRSHLESDRLFHMSPRFDALCLSLAAELRSTSATPHVRSSFLVHVSIELILDACIVEAEPALLDSYYTSLEQLHLPTLQHLVETICEASLPHLSPLIERFCQARFISDYLSDRSLFQRIQQVVRRVKLPAADESLRLFLPHLRARVEDQWRELLAAGHGESSSSWI